MNQKNLKEIKIHYDKALKEKKEYFDCLGTDFHTGYAGFLLEFYSNVLISKKIEPKKKK